MWMFNDPTRFIKEKMKGYKRTWIRLLKTVKDRIENRHRNLRYGENTAVIYTIEAGSIVEAYKGLDGVWIHPPWMEKNDFMLLTGKTYKEI